MSGVLWTLVFICAAISAAIAVHVYIKLIGKRNYWRKLKTNFVPMKPIYSQMYNLLALKRHISLVHEETYDRMGDAGYIGYYDMWNPAVLIRDPDVIRAVLVKDFQHFVNRRRLKFVDQDEIIGNMVSVMKDQKWKNMRSILTPVFTSGKIKRMMTDMLHSGERLCKYIAAITDMESDGDDVHVEECFERYTMDVIETVAFGMSSGCFDSNSKFLEMGKMLFRKFDNWLLIKFLLLQTFPFITKVKKVNLLRKDVVDFFQQAIHAAVEARDSGEVKRNDFLQLLMDARRGELESEDNENGVSDEILFAQSLIFLSAGFDTVAGLLNLTVYELALNPDIQQRLLSEIEETLARSDGTSTYEAVMDMHYLDMVISEILRKYPLASQLQRECNEDYTIPGTDTVIEKGVIVSIPVFQIHRDERFYPEPDKFRPERFTPEEKDNRPQYSYLPFGHGPRNCIGMRFALLESKVCLVVLLRRYEFSPSEKTQIPLDLDTRAAGMKPKGGMHLRVSRRRPK